MRSLKSLVGALGALVLLGSAQAVRAQDVLVPGSPIVAIHNTLAGGNSTASTAGTGIGQYPAGEAAPLAIDDNILTKYLNFGSGSAGTSSATQGTGTGFYVSPTGGSSIIRAVQFISANDAAERDPLAITIEGSNATGAGLALGSNWTLIYAGPSGLAVDPGRRLPGLGLDFPNSTAYTSYRLLTTAHRGVANSVQFAEVSLFVPEPGTAAVAGFAGLGLLVRRRRK